MFTLQYLSQVPITLSDPVGLSYRQYTFCDSPPLALITNTMGGPDQGPATDAAADNLANLHLDEVTGEHVSKSELKKRQKHRAKEAEREKRAAAAPPKPEKKASAEEEESNLTPNVGIPESLLSAIIG